MQSTFTSSATARLFRIVVPWRPAPVTAMVISWILLVCFPAAPLRLAAEEPTTGQTEQSGPTVHVHHCDDFQLDGSGSASAWKAAQWITLKRRKGGTQDYQSRCKMLYSDTGVYVLFDGADQRLSATMEKDFMDLWNEDVYECFFWTDPAHTVYFEYEISPLGHELPILIPNLHGQFLGWRPWHYEGKRKTRKAIQVRGGKQKPHAAVQGWSAEVFIPYDLLKPLKNVPPKPGTHWRANFYRVDYDNNQSTGWDWARVGPSFHEFRKFGTVVFD